MSKKPHLHGLDFWKESKALLHVGEGGNSESATPSKTRTSQDDEEDPWAALPPHFRNKKKIAYIRIHSDLKTATPLSKFRLLLWKDWVTARRTWIRTLIEMLTPVALVAILTIWVSFWSEDIRQASTYASFGFQVPSHAFRNCTKFIFAPDVPVVRDVMSAVELEFSGDGGTKHTFTVVDGDEALMKMGQVDLCAGVVFVFKPVEWLNRLDEFPQHIHYKLRFPAVHRAVGRKDVEKKKSGRGGVTRGKLWLTSDIYPIRLTTGPRNEHDENGGSPGYYEEGFLLLQNLIDEKILHHIYVGGMSEMSGVTEAENTYGERMDKIFKELVRFPYPSNKDNAVVALLHDILPITIVAAYLVPFVLMVYGSVVEKESGIRIQLKSVGIPIPYHKIVWVARCLLMHLPPAAIITAILATNWAKKKKESILTFTSPPIFFLVMAAYIFKTITSSMFLVTFFRRASTATTTCGFLWIASFIPYYYVKSNYNSFALWQRLLCCILGNTGIALGFHLISEAEGHGNVVDFAYMFRGGFYSFSLGWIFCITISFGVVELFLAGYVLKVLPEKGVGALPWNYCLKLWYLKKKSRPDETALRPQLLINQETLEDRFPANFEVDENIKRRKELQMERVSKYTGPDRTLHRVTLNCYEGDVTAVIGQGGSGKSTLLKIIAGLVAPSSGQITVSRQDLSKNPTGANSFVGYCCMENTLYPYLSVEETLTFYCRIKCTAGGLAQWNEVNRFLKEAMLQEYCESEVWRLTTSAKRVLLVACAFIGGSRVVLLDEPTLKMGAAQKRVTWEFIARQKRHRTILVAMGCMNEGDGIVDKLLYLHHGEAVCSGSVRFMQKMFGGGYHLIISKAQDKPCNVEGIRTILSHRVGDIWLSGETGERLDFYLPPDKTPVFPPLFEELSKTQGSLGIAEFYNTYKTMDEVLGNVRRIAMEADYDPEHRQAIYKGVEEIKIDPNYIRLRGCSYVWSCFWLLFLKNWRFLLRRKKALVLTSLAPVIITALTMGGVLLATFEANPKPLLLNFDHEGYKNPKALYTCVDAIHEGGFICDALKSTWPSKYGKVGVTKLVNQSIQEYVLDHYKNFRLEEDAALVGVEVRTNLHNKRNVELVGHFNNQPLHMVPIVLNIMNNALLEYMMSFVHLLHPTYVKRRGFWNYSISVTNEPLPFTAEDHIKFAGMYLTPGFFLGFAISLGYAFLVSNFVVLHVAERDFRHLQMVAGANAWSFWASNYITNFAHFLLGATMVYLVFLAGSPGLSHFEPGDALTLYALSLGYGLCSVFFAGAWSILPNSSGSSGLAYSRLLLFLILTGPLPMLASLALADPSLAAPQVLITAWELGMLFFPSYGIGMGTYFIFSNAVLRDECGNVKRSKNVCKGPVATAGGRPWKEFESREGSEAVWACCVNDRHNSYDILAYGVGQHLSGMALVLILSLLLRILRQSWIWPRLKRALTKVAMRRWEHHDTYDQEVHDYDVLNEMLRVQHSGDDKFLAKESLVIQNLTKEVPGMKRVDNLCLRVDRGECFCLLGISGAGKTATLRMIVGSQMPTSGDAKIGGYSLMGNYPKYIRRFGYCPADSPFLAELTGQEVIQLIGTLRRTPGPVLEGIITNLSLRLLFLHDLDNFIRSYSTNSVRKLSAAVAMIGDPEVVVMDEPTNFIDLISREYLFKCIQSIVAAGTIVILSSKSVIECEQVCSNMAIMVNGHLRCLGSPDHLRDHFAEGFTIIVKFFLDIKKIYFSTTADQYKILAHQQKPGRKKSDKKKDKRQYIDESVGDDRLPAGHITLFPDRVGVSAEMEEDHKLEEVTWEEDLLPFLNYFENKFPEGILVDKQPGFVHYHVRHEAASASQLFETMEQAQVFVSGIDSYYIGKANLDQVYLNFARGQRPTG